MNARGEPPEDDAAREAHHTCRTPASRGSSKPTVAVYIVMQNEPATTQRRGGLALVRVSTTHAD